MMKLLLISFVRSNSKTKFYLPKRCALYRKMKKRELKEKVTIAVRQLLFDRELKKHFLCLFRMKPLERRKSVGI